MDWWRRPLGPARLRRARDQAEEMKASAAGRLAALTSVGRPVWTPRDYEHLSREGFAKNAIAYRCVRMIAEGAASVPLVVFDGDARADARHPLQRLLDRPNPEQGGVELREQFFGALQTAGNAYLEGVVGEVEPAELYALRPDRVKVVPGADGWVAAYDYAVDGRSVRLSRDADGWSPVLHLKLLHPAEDHYGLAPLEAAAFAVDVHNASGAWNKALLDNAARPSGALVFRGEKDGDRLTAEQHAALKTALDATYAGAANAGRPMLLEGGLSWTTMSLTPGEMDFIAGKHAAAREIALAFGLPPQLLGIPGDATYANYREANTAFWRGTVVPLVEKLSAALSGWLGPRFGEDVEVRADWDGVPALSAEREALWARIGAADWLTVDEKRRMAGV